jgi:hypothetical protein
MSVGTRITDGEGTTNEAKVTSRGQLVVAPLDFSEAYNTTLDATGTAYNLVIPKTGKRFVITAILAGGNFNIGVNGAQVELYEASAIDTTTVAKSIFIIPVSKNNVVPLSPLNITLNEGVWLNTKTDDDDVYLTITGYYITA